MSQQPTSRPSDPEQDRLLDHDYDGIREYDNPMPRWWVAIFWATIEPPHNTAASTTDP